MFPAPRENPCVHKHHALLPNLIPLRFEGTLEERYCHGFYSSYSLFTTRTIHHKHIPGNTWKSSTTYLKHLVSKNQWVFNAKAQSMQRKYKPLRALRLCVYNTLFSISTTTMMSCFSVIHCLFSTLVTQQSYRSAPRLMQKTNHNHKLQSAPEKSFSS